jgi:uncharacterized protein YndB with AHSA1/START domain
MHKENVMNTSPFILTRTLNAPRELVWKIWTDPNHLAQWWGPKGFRVDVAKLDLRPGGTFHYGMHAPSGAPMWGLFQYREVTPPERLVFLNSFSNENGDVTRAPFNGDWPLHMLSTITFAARGNTTEVTVQWEPFEASAAEWATFDEGRASMTGGWSGTFEQLEAYLEKTK